MEMISLASLSTFEKPKNLQNLMLARRITHENLLPLEGG